MKNFIEKLIRKFAPKVKEEINERAQKAVGMLKFKVGNYDHTEKLNIEALKETKKYIGELILEGATELGNWHDKAEGDTFFRARLVFPGSQD